MNTLEKILKEIEEKTIIVATSKEHYNQPQNGEFVEEVITIKNVEDIIRSHMDELPNGIKEVSKEQLNQIPVATPEFLQECQATAEKYEKGKRMKDDLISRKAEIERVNKVMFSHNPAENTVIKAFIRSFLETSKSAYDLEKVIEQLEELRDRFTVEDYHIRGIIEKAIEIVRKGGVE